MKDDNAFPAMEYDTTAGQRFHYGLSKREYAAIQAMAAMAAKFAEGGFAAEYIAADAIALADALLSQLQEGE